MEATLCLHHSLSPSPLSLLSPTFKRPITLTNHPNLTRSFSGHISIKTVLELRPRAYFFNRLPALGIKNSNNDGRRSSEKLVAATVLGCCILGVMCSSPRMCPLAVAEVVKVERGVAWRSYLPAKIDVLDKWLWLNLCLSENLEGKFGNLLKDSHPNVSKLKTCIANMEMVGKEDMALRMLSKEIDKRREQMQLKEVDLLEMLLVEMLICQGKYKDALKVKCLGNQEISDPRRPLYKAIINVMLGDSGQAKANLKQFHDLRSTMPIPFCRADGPPSDEAQEIFDKAVKSQYNEAEDYKNFENMVKGLHKELVGRKKHR